MYNKNTNQNTHNSSSLTISIKVNYLQRFYMIKYNGKTLPVYYKIKFYEKM